jgi:hypothetical protein
MVITGLILAGATHLHAEEADAELSPQLVAEIRRQIGDLDADSFDARETAQHQLWLIGPPAAPFLEEAAKEGSPEVRFRADALLRSIQRGPLKIAIEAFCSQPEETLDLEQGMWLIARIGNPKLKLKDLTRHYDEIADLVRQKLGKDVDPAQANPQLVVAALREVMFDALGFNTNKQDYDNPENAFPDRVVTTRKGRPVHVSQVVVVVARRLKVPIVGLPVNGMYSVKYDGAKAPKGFPRDDIVFYPHDRGRVLTRQDFPKLLGAAGPEDLPPPSTPRQALVRMLSNLTSLLDHHPQRSEELQLANEMLLRLKRAADDE